MSDMKNKQNTKENPYFKKYGYGNFTQSRLSLIKSSFKSEYEPHQVKWSTSEQYGRPMGNVQWPTYEQTGRHLVFIQKGMLRMCVLASSRFIAFKWVKRLFSTPTRNRCSSNIKQAEVDGVFVPGEMTLICVYRYYRFRKGPDRLSKVPCKLYAFPNGCVPGNDMDFGPCFKIKSRRFVFKEPGHQEELFLGNVYKPIVVSLNEEIEYLRKIPNHYYRVKCRETIRKNYESMKRRVRLCPCTFQGIMCGNCSSIWNYRQINASAFDESSTSDESELISEYVSIL